MNVEVKQLKDTLTGEVFVPLTHWDAIANKPEDIAKEVTSQEILKNIGDLTNTSVTKNELSTTKQEIVDSIKTLQEYIASIEAQLQNRGFARMVVAGVNGSQSFNIATIKANGSYSIENNVLICESDEIDATKTLIMSGGTIENNILNL